MPTTKVPWVQSPSTSHVAQPEWEFLLHLRKLGIRGHLPNHSRKYYRREKVSTADSLRHRTFLFSKCQGFLSVTLRTAFMLLNYWLFPASKMNPQRKLIASPPVPYPICLIALTLLLESSYLEKAHIKT